MEHIISKTQNAFIRGHQILDSVLIANGCIDNHLNQRGLGGLHKLDLEKAYDHVSEDFFALNLVLLVTFFKN
jgi:hypothetical protein